MPLPTSAFARASAAPLRNPAAGTAWHCPRLFAFCGQKAWVLFSSAFLPRQPPPSLPFACANCSHHTGAAARPWWRHYDGRLRAGKEHHAVMGCDEAQQRVSRVKLKYDLASRHVLRREIAAASKTPSKQPAVCAATVICVALHKGRKLIGVSFYLMDGPFAARNHVCCGFNPNWRPGLINAPPPQLRRRQLCLPRQGWCAAPQTRRR